MPCVADGEWYFLHKWSKWKAEKQPISRAEGTPRERIVGFFVEQHRICERCGKVETETSQHTL